MRKKILIAVLLIVVGAIAGWYVVQRHAPHNGPQYIVSLGDSVTAGDGLPVDKSDDAVAAACSRSKQAYPNLIAKQLHAKLKPFACSGAQVTAGLLQQQTANGTMLPPQLDAAKPYFAGNDVVLTIGANDVNWTTMLTQCAQTDCTAASRLADFQAKLQQLRLNLNLALPKIHAAHPRHVILNAYYPLLNDRDTCFAAAGITSAKIQWVNARETELNGVLTIVAKQYGITVVRIDFSGHLLCNIHPWIQGIFAGAPLHPNQAGQQQIARQDIAVLR